MNSIDTTAPWLAWAKGLGVAVAVFGAIFLLASPSHHHHAPTGLRGQIAPSFTLEPLGFGEATSLESLRGKPVILNFWAAWCAPCLEELPLFEKLHREHPTLVQVITISADDPLALKRVMTQGDYTLPCLLDSTGEVTARYAVERLPRTLVIDSSGKVLSDQTGQLDQASLKALLAGLR